MIDLDKILVPEGYQVSAKEIRDEIDRMRGALEKIAYMDDFLTGDSAKLMMNIAREALTSR